MDKGRLIAGGLAVLVAAAGVIAAALAQAGGESALVALPGRTPAPALKPAPDSTPLPWPPPGWEVRPLPDGGFFLQRPPDTPIDALPEPPAVDSLGNPVRWGWELEDLTDWERQDVSSGRFILRPAPPPPPGVPTSPPWDGQGTPPPGWEKHHINSETGSFSLAPVPACGPRRLIDILGCAPKEATMTGKSYHCEGPCPEEIEDDFWTIQLGDSIVELRLRYTKDAAEPGLVDVTVLKWQVAPEHEEAFKRLHDVLFGP